MLPFEVQGADSTQQAINYRKQKTPADQDTAEGMTPAGPKACWTQAPAAAKGTQRSRGAPQRGAGPG